MLRNASGGGGCMTQRYVALHYVYRGEGAEVLILVLPGGVDISVKPRQAKGKAKGKLAIMMN